MKNFSYSLGLLTGTAAAFLVSPSTFAAISQITEIDLDTSKQGLELRLETSNSNLDKSSFLTVSDDNKIETTILNAELNLKEKEGFLKNNPAPGIKKIAIDRSNKEHTKIVITKDANVKLDSLVTQEGKDLFLTLKNTNPSPSLLSKIPLIGNILNRSSNKEIEKPGKIKKENKLNYIREIDRSKNLKNKTIIADSRIQKKNNSRQDILVPNPEIEIRESNGDRAIDIQAQTPTIPEPTYLPRAVAPPVGDIAVSSINTFPDIIDLGSNATVPRLVLRDASVREVLSLLARQAGLNVVFASSGEESEEDSEQTISLDLENQSVQEAFNSIILVSNLSASRRGNIIYIGEELPAQARNLVSRTLRLNQVRANTAALFLASQGASGNRLTTEFEETTDPETGRVVQRREISASLEELGGDGDEEDITSPKVLKGLRIATDDRLNSITLVGEARKVEMATVFLTQLDARRRQVAVNVKVIDVNLLNQDVFNSSFSFGINDSFFVQDNGAATLRFGETRPTSSADINTPTGQFTNPPAINNPFSGTNTFLDFDRTFEVPGTVPGVIDQNGNVVVPRGTGLFFDRNAGISSDPFSTGVTERTLADFGQLSVDEDGNITFEPGTEGSITQELPGLFQFPKKFLALLEARVTSGNAKILTDPTMVVQEGQQATVKLAQNVVESVNTTIDGDSGARTITPVLAEAGLVLTVNIEKIDDNGFINLSVSPTISSIGSTVEFDSGAGASNVLSLLSKREISSGLIRLRDGQTLILSGIIQDQERSTVSKVPILGDIPLLGSLFRSTDKTNERAEVIVLLTPQVLDEQSGFGYNYQPGKDAREMLKNNGVNLPNNPQ